MPGILIIKNPEFPYEGLEPGSHLRDKPNTSLKRNMFLFFDLLALKVFL